MPEEVDLNEGNENISNPGVAKNGGLTDAPIKSPLEQSTAASSTVQPNPVASSAMPEVAPQAPVDQAVSPAPIGDTSQEETASVPDTDKFLESILEDNSQGQASTRVSPESPVLSGTAPIATGGASDEQESVNINVNQPSTPEKPMASFQQSEQQIPQQEQVPAQESSSQISGQPKIKDDIKSIDTMINGITPPKESSKPITENPVGMMRAQRGAGKSKATLLIILLLILGGGGYYAYNYMFGGSPSSQESEAVNTTETTESNLAQTNDEIRKEDLATIQIALQNYFSATGNYPISNGRESLSTSDNILEKELVGAGYIDALPYDPESTKYYAYKSDDGTSFSLTALLDDATDADAVISGGLALYEITQDSVVTTSPNSYTNTSDTGVADEVETTYGNSTDSETVTDLPVE